MPFGICISDSIITYRVNRSPAWRHDVILQNNIYHISSSITYPLFLALNNAVAVDKQARHFGRQNDMMTNDDGIS